MSSTEGFDPIVLVIPDISLYSDNLYDRDTEYKEEERMKRQHTESESESLKRLKSEVDSLPWPDEESKQEAMRIMSNYKDEPVMISASVTEPFVEGASVTEPFVEGASVTEPLAEESKGSDAMRALIEVLGKPVQRPKEELATKIQINVGYALQTLLDLHRENKNTGRFSISDKSPKKKCVMDDWVPRSCDFCKFTCEYNRLFTIKTEQNVIEVDPLDLHLLVQHKTALNDDAIVKALELTPETVDYTPTYKQERDWIFRCAFSTSMKILELIPEGAAFVKNYKSDSFHIIVYDFQKERSMIVQGFKDGIGKQVCVEGCVIRIADDTYSRWNLGWKHVIQPQEWYL